MVKTMFWVQRWVCVLYCCTHSSWSCRRGQLPTKRYVMANSINTTWNPFLRACYVPLFTWMSSPMVYGTETGRRFNCEIWTRISNLVARVATDHTCYQIRNAQLASFVLARKKQRCQMNLTLLARDEYYVSHPPLTFSLFFLSISRFSRLLQSSSS